MPPVLSIDLGSAYTKVAVLRGPDETSDLVRDEKLNFDDERFCIPSVVVSNFTGTGPALLCALDAVGLKDGHDLKVHRNWKKRLFTPLIPATEPEIEIRPQDKVQRFLDRLEELSARHRLLRELATFHDVELVQVRDAADEAGLTTAELKEGLRRLSRTLPLPGSDGLAGGTARHSSGIDPETREISLAYFRWLRDFLTPSLQNLGLDVETLPVRVCVPAFRKSPDALTPAEEHLVEVMQNTGWSPDLHHPVLVEPLANAVGILTGGVNRTWVPLRPKNSPRTINLGQMFQEGPVQRILKSKRSSEAVRVVVIDIGAFTADYALVTFRRDGLECTHEVQEHSEPLGIIEELDRRVRTALPTAQAQWFANMDVRRQEMFRNNVYASRRPVKLSEKETVTKEQVEDIQGILREYAGDIVTRLDECFGEEVKQIDELVLTGGGNNIPAVRDAFAKKLMPRGVQVLHVPSAEGSRKPGLHPLGQALVRGGSAIGGASIYIDYQLPSVYRDEGGSVPLARA